MSEEVNIRKWLRRGAMIGGAVGSIYLMSNRKARKKITDCIGDCTTNTKRWFSVIKENKEPFIQQLKDSGEKISVIVENASEDIEKIMMSSQHIKEHAKEMMETLTEAKEDLQSLTKKLKGNETIEVDELLPSSDEEELR